MFFLTPIIAGLLAIGTIGAGTVVEHKAQDLVAQYNLAAVSHVLEIYYVDHGNYPQGLRELTDEGEIKNLNSADYNYSVSKNGQQIKICKAQTSKCFSSDTLFADK